MTHDTHYLQLLSTTFPNVAAASTEIINLEAILNLPKGTEHFLADLHGESAAFKHVLKNASGNIRRKVSELFKGDIRESERRELCTLIYYPEEKIELIIQMSQKADDIVSDCLDPEFTYINIDGFDFPNVPDEWGKALNEVSIEASLSEQ